MERLGLIRKVCSISLRVQKEVHLYKYVGKNDYLNTRVFKASRKLARKPRKNTPRPESETDSESRHSRLSFNVLISIFDLSDPKPWFLWGILRMYP